MIDEIRNTFRNKWTKLYLYLWLWGDKTKLEEEKRRRILQDEHDILKDQFDKRNHSSLTYLELEGLNKLVSQNSK